MAWGSNVAATQLDPVSDSEQFFDVTPQLNPGETCHVQIRCAFGGTTDNLVVAVYGYVNGSDYDTQPLLMFEMDPNDDDPGRKSFVIRDVYQFRVGVYSAGATDDHTVDMDSRVDGVSL